MSCVPKERRDERAKKATWVKGNGNEAIVFGCEFTNNVFSVMFRAVSSDQLPIFKHLMMAND